MKNDLKLYDYLPWNHRPVIRWPNNAKLAFWVAPNIEYYELDPPNNPLRTPWAKPLPDLVPYSERDHGNRVGHWRMMEVMDKYNVRGSISLSVALLDHHPEIIEACKQRNWEFFSHGIYNTRYSYAMTREQELSIINDSIENVKKHTGQMIAGYLAPALTHTERTMDLLAEKEILYTCDLFIDDQPFPVNVDSGKLISIPYSLEMNDIIVYNSYMMPPRHYANMLKSNFDRLRKDGSKTGTVMCIPLHAYAVAQGHRINAFDEALKYITGHDDIWVATGKEIADYFYDNYYDEFIEAIARFKKLYPTRS